MDRNTIIGFLLIGVTLILFAYFNRPDKSQQKNDQTVQTEQAATKTDTNRPAPVPDTNVAPVDTLKEKTVVVLPELFDKFTKGEDQFTVLENELVKIKVSSKGGRISYVELKKYKTYDKKPLVIFDGDESKFGYEFSFENKLINSADLYFTPSGGPAMAKGKDSVSLSMFVKMNDSTFIEHKYTLYGDDYMIKSSITLSGFDKVISQGVNYFDLSWSLKTRYLERKTSKRNEKLTGSSSTIYYQFVNESPDKLTEGKDQKKDLAGQIKWLSFKQHFFTSILIADNNFIRGMAENTSIEDGFHYQHMSASLSFPFDHNTSVQTYGLKYYFGPNHFKTLKKYDLNLERHIFLGKGLLRWINTGIVIPVFNFLSKYISNYGIIILLLTIFIKVILLPLTYKSYLSTARMRLLKPDIDAIKARVGNDMTKVQAEQMKLYRSAGVSPLGGCLPMLLQMPILIAMFRFFPSSIELRQEAFLWANDLSTFDSIYDFPNGFKIPGYGDHISLFTLLMTISTIIYTKMNSDMMGGETAKQMKVIQYIMPIMFLGFFNNYSAGLSYYYFLANVLTFGQQYLFKLFIDEDKLHKQIELNKLKKSSKPKSKWVQRLENMQKQGRKR